MNLDTLQTMLYLVRSRDKQFEPMVWMPEVSNKTPSYNNALPIHKKLYDVANMMVYENHLQIMSFDPRAELVGVTTYSLCYINIDNGIHFKWGEVKGEWLPPTPGQVYDISRFTRQTEYAHTIKSVLEHTRTILDDDNIESIRKHGGSMDGEGGSVKSKT